MLLPLLQTLGLSSVEQNDVEERRQGMRVEAHGPLLSDCSSRAREQSPFLREAKFERVATLAPQRRRGRQGGEDASGGRS